MTNQLITAVNKGKRFPVLSKQTHRSAEQHCYSSFVELANNNNKSRLSFGSALQNPNKLNIPFLWRYFKSVSY